MVTVVKFKWNVKVELFLLQQNNDSEVWTVY